MARGRRSGGGEDQERQVMNKPLSQQVIEKLKHAEKLYHRLILIVGPKGTGKTSALQDVAGHVNALSTAVRRSRVETAASKRSGRGRARAGDALDRGGGCRQPRDSGRGARGCANRPPLKVLHEVSMVPVCHHGCLTRRTWPMDPPRRKTRTDASESRSRCAFQSRCCAGLTVTSRPGTFRFRATTGCSKRRSRSWTSNM